MSVISATSLQRQVAYLNSPLDIRLWLSSGLREQGNFEGILFEARSSHKKEDMLLESSISALHASEAPHMFLQLALTLFLAGFGLYVLLSWIDDVEGARSDWRNAFLLFICVVGLACAHALVVRFFRGNDARRTKPVRKLMLEINKQKTKPPESPGAGERQDQTGSPWPSASTDATGHAHHLNRADEAASIDV